MIQTTGGNASDKLVIRSGYGDFPDNTGDWTILARFKYNGSIAMGTYANILSLFAGLTDFTDPYFAILSDAATDNISFWFFNGTTEIQSPLQAIVAGAQNWVAVTYNTSTNTGTLIVNGVSVGTVVVNMSSVVFNKLLMMGDGATLNKSAISVAYLFGWSTIKSIAELTAQAASITPIDTTTLLFNNPLQTGIDLTSHNNTLNQLSAVGTVTTDTTDPLLSIIASPPININPATATDITLNSALFVDTLSSGSAAAETWYKYTAQVGDGWLGSDAFGDLVTFKPRMFIYEGLANANSLTPYKNLSPANNGTLQFIVTAGNTYYFREIRNGAVSPATAIISILKGPNLAIPVGAVGINDDTSNEYPLIFVSTTNDNIVYNFADIVAGEQGDVLPVNGFTLVADQIDNAGNFIYNQLFQEIDDITTISGLARIRTCNTPGIWYLSVNTNPPTVRTIDKNSNIGPTITLTGSTSIGAHAASNDETKLYYAETGANKPVKVWDLVNNTALANLVAGIANYVITDILYLGNDQIAVMYYKSSVTRDSLLKIYNIAGVVQVSQSLGIPDGSAGPRICYAINDPISLWAYNHIVTANSVLQNVTVASGAIAVTRTVPTFESGAGVTPTTNTPPRFGASFSCPIWVVRVASVLNIAKSGLYILTGTGGNFGGITNPILRHDVDWIDTSLGTSENVKIPDPFYDTYLAGDE